MWAHVSWYSRRSSDLRRCDTARFFFTDLLNKSFPESHAPIDVPALEYPYERDAQNAQIDDEPYEEVDPGPWVADEIAVTFAPFWSFTLHFQNRSVLYSHIVSYMGGRMRELGNCTWKIAEQEQLSVEVDPRRNGWDSAYWIDKNPKRPLIPIQSRCKPV